MQDRPKLLSPIEDKSRELQQWHPTYWAHSWSRCSIGDRDETVKLHFTLFSHKSFLIQEKESRSCVAQEKTAWQFCVFLAWVSHLELKLGNNRGTSLQAFTAGSWLSFISAFSTIAIAVRWLGLKNGKEITSTYLQWFGNITETITHWTRFKH